MSSPPLASGLINTAPEVYAEPVPDAPDYCVRQHSVIGLGISLQKGEYVQPGVEAGGENGLDRQRKVALFAYYLLFPLFLSSALSGNNWHRAFMATLFTIAGGWLLRVTLRSELAVAPFRVPATNVDVSLWPHGVYLFLSIIGSWSFFGLIFRAGRMARIGRWLLTMLFLLGGELLLRGVLWRLRWFPAFLPGLAPTHDGGGNASAAQTGPGYVPPHPQSFPAAAV